MARSVGIQVNNDTTSKDTRISSLGIVWDLMNSTKAWEFLTWELVKPTIGESRPTRNLESSYVGEDTNETMGRRGTLACVLWAACTAVALWLLSSSAVNRHQGGVVWPFSGPANVSSFSSRETQWDLSSVVCTCLHHLASAASYHHSLLSPLPLWPSPCLLEVPGSSCE